MYVCICYAVTETELTGVLAAGARSEEEVGDACGAGTGCGSCLDRICDRLRAVDPLHGLQVATSAA
ncbi:bacterioferritin-associated ferredoxin [Blastococcus sp. URHD0036]|uniref:(2Fe-2S)-binding protein n=1 Tax=Blastococcus sp. URHD0036 TaxID=1380356 RepID=UPI0005528D49|nr:(2Fe-2S)-binding protein [Blastococcus sp. URHD0036]